MHSSSDSQENYIIFTIHVSTISENVHEQNKSLLAARSRSRGVGGGVGMG